MPSPSGTKKPPPDQGAGICCFALHDLFSGIFHVARNPATNRHGRI